MQYCWNGYSGKNMTLVKLGATVFGLSMEMPLLGSIFFIFWNVGK